MTRCNECGKETPTDIMRQVMILSHDATNAARMGERVACARDLRRALEIVEKFHDQCEGRRESETTNVELLRTIPSQMSTLGPQVLLTTPSDAEAKEIYFALMRLRDK